MAISSVNFQKAKSNSVEETRRHFEAKYLLPKEHRKGNELYDCGIDEKELFNQELAKAERKGGRVPKVENSLWEGVINLNHNHTIEDVNRVGEHIAKKFNIHYTRGALHRDEGHIKDTGEVVYNFHAHINFMTYKDGKQNWRLEFINKKALKELQTEVAELLDMQRGEFNSKSVRANHRHFRAKAEHIKKEREAVKELEKELAKAKDLQEINKELRAELKEAAATREDYAKLEQLNKDLKEQIKAKALSIDDLHQQIEAYKKEKEHYKSIVEIQEIEIIDLKKDIDISQTNRNTPKTNENILNDKSIEKINKEVLGLFTSDFKEEIELKKGMFEKKYTVELKEKFENKPTNLEEIGLFNRTKIKFLKLIDTIKEQTIKILGLEKENKALKKENQNLLRENRELELQVKQLSKEKSEHSILNSEKKEIKTQEEPITFDNAMDFIKNEMLKEEQKKPFKLKEKDKSNQLRRNR